MTRKPQDIAGGQEKARPNCKPESYEEPCGICPACEDAAVEAVDIPPVVAEPLAPASVQDQERPIAKDPWGGHSRECFDDDCSYHGCVCPTKRQPAPPIAKAEEPPAKDKQQTWVRSLLLESALRVEVGMLARELCSAWRPDELKVRARLEELVKMAQAAALAESADRGEEANG